jgi:hypothetical protein
MSFVRQKIDADYEMVIARSATPGWRRYDSHWAIDCDTGDCLYFEGCDQLDRSVPSTFVLLLNGRETSLWLDVISASDVPNIFRDEHIESPDSRLHFFAVLKNGDWTTIDDPHLHDMAQQAFCVLTETEATMKFLPNWNRLYEIQKQIETENGIAFARQTTTEQPVPTWMAWISKFLTKG